MTQLTLNSEGEEGFEERTTYFADIILPVPLPGAYTYRVPQSLNSVVQTGGRVVVQFGKNKVMTGIVMNVHTQAPKKYEAKYLMDYLDLVPTVNQKQLTFFQWIAEYYMCTIGEVVNAALPSGLKISSESQIQLNPIHLADDENHEYSDKELKVLEALKTNQKLSFEEVSDLLGIKMIHPVIKSLIQKESILLFEQIKDKYTPKSVKILSLASKYVKNEFELEHLFSLLEKKPKQQEILLKYLTIIRLDQKKNVIHSIEKSLLNIPTLSDSALKTLIKNGVFVETEKIISRLENFKKEEDRKVDLSNQQTQALKEIIEGFEENKPVLLHGVTGSGKTEIYIEAIKMAMENGGQVLYLLPEIALTTQIVSRLIKVFGNEMGVFHSKYSDNERVEVWNGVNQKKINFVVGVRSSVFLPFDDLDLIIIDEEHETSYKQYEPSPRYHARDAAIWLSHLHGAKVLMGTATPSIESYQNALDNKYKLVELQGRFGEAVLPRFVVANILSARKTKRIKGDFTPELVEAIHETLDKNRQVILFQNRRGYSPYLICNDCNHVPRCDNCDVSLTYHMNSHQLICHYCGHKESMPAICSTCQSTGIKTMGFGTEKLEDDLKLLFPNATVQRMDQDSTRSKHSYQRIIDHFESGETNILVGTQMLSKGLHFEKVDLVGIFDFDRMMGFPDFRSHERTFQMITQVSGRAGRSSHQGKVIIQTGSPDADLLMKIMRGDFHSFFAREILERENFKYPPFYRMIKVSLKHKDKIVVQKAVNQLANTFRAELGAKRILGPQSPVVSRIRNLFIEEVFIKVDKKEVNIKKVKEVIYKLSIELKSKNEFSSVRVVFDVDPV